MGHVMYNDLSDIDERMELSGGRSAVGVTDSRGRKYYIEYPTERAPSMESAKQILIDQLAKRFG